MQSMPEQVLDCVAVAAAAVPVASVPVCVAAANVSVSEPQLIASLVGSLDAVIKSPSVSVVDTTSVPETWAVLVALDVMRVTPEDCVTVARSVERKVDLDAVTRVTPEDCVTVA